MKKALAIIGIICIATLIVCAAMFGYAVHDLKHMSFDREGVSWRLDGDVVYVSGKGELSSLYMSETGYVWGKKDFNPFYSLAVDLLDGVPAKTVVIGEGVTGVGEYVFTRCPNLTGITVAEENPCLTAENGVLFNKDKTVLLAYPQGNGAEAYTVPQGVKEIAEHAFSDAVNLKSVVFPGSLEKICYAAFTGCENLGDIEFAEGLKEIELTAFYGCVSLKKVTLPEGLTTLGTHVFSSCTALKSVYLPASLTSIEEFTFDECSSLTSFTVSKKSKTFSAVKGVLFSADKTVLVRYLPGAKSGDYEVPAGVTEIADEAFSGCGNLTGVTLPDTLLRIGEGAFIDCDALKRVTVPDSVLRIEFAAFQACTSLKEVVLGKGLTFIGIDAFYHDTALKSITVPANVKEIGLNAFGYRNYELGGAYQLQSGFTILCPDNSAALRYAKENGISYKII